MKKISTRFCLLACAVVALSAVFLTPYASAQTRRTSTMRRTQTNRPTSFNVPVGTQMKIRLETEIDTKGARDGDRFTAIVLTPSRYADATIEGHIAKVDKSGKMKGRTEVALAFDRVVLNDGRSDNIAGQVVRVYGEDSVREVDEEGNVRGKSKGKDTAIRTGGGAALGAIIGGIAGGGKGAAIGAAVGAGAGAGSTYIQGSSRVKLERGTEILIKTTR